MKFPTHCVSLVGFRFMGKKLDIMERHAWYITMSMISMISLVKLNEPNPSSHWIGDRWQAGEVLDVLEARDMSEAELE